MSYHDEFIRQSAQLERMGKTPRLVVFNSVGATAALAAQDANTLFYRDPRGSEFYCGLPYITDPASAASILVTDKTADEYRTPPVVITKTGVLPHRERVKGDAVTFRVDHLDPFKTTMNIAGQALSRVQLSDLLQAYIDANPGEPVGHLQTWLAQHGRFE